MSIHSSILVWRIPWTEEPDRLESIQRVGHDGSDSACTGLGYWGMGIDNRYGLLWASQVGQW